MNICEGCIHSEVCKKWWNDEDVVCPHRETEANSLHILRLIYADFMGSSNRCRLKSDDYHVRNKPESALVLRRESEIYSSCASRVKIYCHKLGFDPSKKIGGENE